MTQCTADFEGGTNGNAVLVADSGSATAWNAKTVSGTAVLTYDNSVAAHGNLCMKVNAGASGSVGYMSWTTALGTLTDHYGRFYYYATANPASDQFIWQAPKGGATGPRIRLTSTGKLIATSTNAFLTTFTNSITLNAWVRIEYHMVHSTTVGSFELKLFNTPDSTTATETQTSAANKNMSVSCDEIQVGNHVPVNANWIERYDDIVVGATSYPGPVVASSSYAPGFRFGF